MASAHDLALEEPGGFSDEELARIRCIGDAQEFTDVKLYGRWTQEDVRARGAHFRRTEETEWVFARMWERVMALNEASYRFDLTGFHENFYYHVYRGDNESHFGWHVDAGGQTPAPRKLSAVLQLSDPAEYEGGDLELHHGRRPVAVEKEKGLLILFPSHRLHRVTPVTAGIRRTLVMFAHGPEFR